MEPRTLHRSDVGGRVRHDDVATSADVDPSGDGGIDAPVLAELQSPTVANTLLRSGTSVTASLDGRLVATVELHGVLCAATAPQLHDEIRQLIGDGVTDLVIDLTDLQLCTSHGLDIFDQAHQRLRDSGGHGAVRLRHARGAVDRVLTIVEDADPTFPPLRHITAA